MNYLEIFVNNSEELLQKEIMNNQSDPSYSYLKVGSDSRPLVDYLTTREMGKSFYKLAKIHYDKSDLLMAEGYFIKALNCCALPTDIFAIFKILGFLIRISSERQETVAAEKYIGEAEVYVEKLTSILGSLNGEYFYNVGIVKNYRGLFLESKENFELAYRKALEENEVDLQAKTLLALANNSYGQKNYAQALIYLKQLDQLLDIVEKDYLKGSMYLFWGRICLEQEEYDDALRYLDKAILKLQVKKSWNLYGYVLLGKGKVYKQKGEYDKALTFFKMAKDATDERTFKRLSSFLSSEIQEVNDNSIDLYLDRVNRKVVEKHLGTIDFKHRFVLLEILFLLAKNAGAFYDKEQLAKSIWKDEYNPLIHDKLIYTSVSRLRKLIEPNKANLGKRKYIVRGKDGYTFNPRANIRFHLEGKVESNRPIANIELNSPV